MKLSILGLKMAKKKNACKQFVIKKTIVVRAGFVSQKYSMCPPPTSSGFSSQTQKVKNKKKGKGARTYQYFNSILFELCE